MLTLRCGTENRDRNSSGSDPILKIALYVLLDFLQRMSNLSPDSSNTFFITPNHCEELKQCLLHVSYSGLHGRLKML